MSVVNTPPSISPPITSQHQNNNNQIRNSISSGSLPVNLTNGTSSLTLPRQSMSLSTSPNTLHSIASPTFFSPPSTPSIQTIEQQQHTSSSSSSSQHGTLKKKESIFSFVSDRKSSNGSDDSKSSRIRSQSEHDLVEPGNPLKESNEKVKKSNKLVLSPKLLIPSKKNQIGCEDPPISKTLDNRVKSNPYIKKFKLPSNEILLNDYSAALYRQILLHGRLYLFSNYICFESKIFGIKTTEIINIKEITSIRKKSKKFQFPVGIEIVVQNQRFSFASFVSRDRTFNDLMTQWREVTGESHDEISSQSIDDDDDESHTTNNNVFESENGELNGIANNNNGVNLSSTNSSLPEVVQKEQSTTELIVNSNLVNGSNHQNGIHIEQKKMNIVNEVAINNINNNNTSNNNNNININQTEQIVSTEITSLIVEQQQKQQSEQQQNNSTTTTTTTSTTTSVSASLPPKKQEEKSAFDELYGSIDQYMSTIEQSSILESQSSEFQELLSDNFNVSVTNFFRALCTDKCNFAFNYHTKRGDKNIVVKNWAHRERFGNIRELEYVAPVNSPIGPDKTRIQETQRYHLTTKKLMIETDTIMLDIPYGDHFRIEAKWDVVETSPETCRLTIQMCVRFIKKTWFKSKIETTTIKESKGSFTQWVQLAKQEIQKALAMKRPTSNNNNVPSINITSLNRSIDKIKTDEIGGSTSSNASMDKTIDSPKPHHSRSRSRQHLVTSSSQVTTHQQQFLQQLHNQVVQQQQQQHQQQQQQLHQPVLESSPLPPQNSQHISTPLSSANSPLSNVVGLSSTKYKDKSKESFRLKVSSSYGKINITGYPLLSLIILLLSIFLYMYIKLLSLGSKVETMEMIFSTFLNQNNNLKKS